MNTIDQNMEVNCILAILYRIFYILSLVVSVKDSDNTLNINHVNGCESGYFFI